MSARRGGKPKRSRPRRDKGGGVSSPSRSRTRASPRMSQRLKLPAQVKVRGKVYTEHTGAYTIEEAERKARDIRGRGYKATIRRGNYRGQPVYTVYARKEAKA